MDNELKLLSPAGADSVLYYWPLCKTKQYNGAAEIVDTIRWVSEDYPELKIVLEKYVLTSVDLNSYESMKTLCDKYNKAVTTYRHLWKGATKPNSKASQWASPPLLRHIIQQCYNRSVVDPDKLNQYEPFSPEVYGETSFDLVNRMLEEVKLAEDDVFVDLGSGVGQVVIHIAAASKCSRCVGIEKSDVPSEFAVNIEKEFRKWMKWYGKKYQDFELIKGDFFDPAFREIIMSSNLIFVNNFAFGPEVDHKLKLIFADVRDGTKIVSSKAFCPLNFRITDRHMSEIGSIMKVHELSSMAGAVSWTGKPVTYYLHTIDRSKLESYFTTVKNNGNGNGHGHSHHQHHLPSHDDAHSKRPSSASAESNNGTKSPVLATPASHVHNPLSSQNPGHHHEYKHQPVRAAKKHASNDEDETTVVYGPTTRRQWSSWVAQQEKIKRKNQDKDLPSKKPSALVKKLSTSSMHAPKSPMSSAPSMATSDDKDNVSTTSEASASDRGCQRRRRRSGAAVGAARTSAILSAASDEQSMGEESTVIVRRPGRPRKLTGMTAVAMLKARQDAAKRKIRKRKLRCVSTSSAPKSVGGVGGSSSAKSAASKKASTEWLQTLDLFHKQIVDGAAVAPAGAQMSTLPEMHSPKTADLTMISPVSTTTSLQPPDDAMSVFLQKVRHDFEQFMYHMQSSQFRNEVVASIDAEQKRQKSLNHRKEQLEKQVLMLQEEGSQLLKNRLAELDMKAVTPAELLNKAKEIVVQHQELQAKAALLESEVKTLEVQNKQLLALTKANDEAALKSSLAQSLGIDATSHEEAKKAILMEIGSLFSHRKAYLNEISRMENEIRLMESLVQMNSNNAGLPDTAALLKSPFTSSIVNMPIAQSVAPQSTVVLPSIATSTAAAKSASQMAAVPVAASQQPATVLPGRRSRGAGRGGRGSSVTGLRKRPAVHGAASVTTSIGLGAGGAEAAAVAFRSVDAQRRDDIDEQVEEMVRKIKNMNNAAILSSAVDKDGKKSGGKSAVAVTLPDKKPSTSSAAKSPSSGSAASTSNGGDKRRGDRKRPTPSSIDQTVDAVSHGYSTTVGTCSPTVSAVTIIASPVKPVFVSPASAAAASTVLDEQAATVVVAAEAVQIGTRRGSLSSVTDSVPSDHEESHPTPTTSVIQKQPVSVDGTVAPLRELPAFITDIDAAVVERPGTEPTSVTRYPIPTKTCRRSSSVGPDIGFYEQQKTLIDGHETGIVPKENTVVQTQERDVVLKMKMEQGHAECSAVFPDTALTEHVAFNVLECSLGSTPVRPTVVCTTSDRTTCSTQQQRPSSVPVGGGRSTVKPAQSPSPFSIGALLIDERPTIFAGVSDIKTETNADTSAYPRVRSANARIEQSATATCSAVASDSGYVGSSSSTTSHAAGADTATEPGSTSRQQMPPVAVHESARESIPSPNRFKNTSNTGQPGNPHDYSNPGNPSTSAAAAAAARHAHVTPQDVIESKTLLNPFRIPRRSATTAADAAAGAHGRSTLDGDARTTSVLDHRSPLAGVTSSTAAGATASATNNQAFSGAAKQRFQGAGARKRRFESDSDYHHAKRNRPMTTVAPRADKAAAVSSSTGAHQNRSQAGAALARADKKPEATYSVSSPTSSHTGNQRRTFFTRFHSSVGPPLTREYVERNSSSVLGHHFSQPGLMEALLEHKMTTGKVESHAVLATKLGDYFADGVDRRTAAPAPGPKTPAATPPSSCVVSVASPTSDDDLVTAAMNQKLSQASPDCGAADASTDSKDRLAAKFPGQDAKAHVNEQRVSQDTTFTKCTAVDGRRRKSTVSAAHRDEKGKNQKTSSPSKESRPLLPAAVEHERPKIVSNNNSSLDVLNQLAALANIDPSQASQLLSEEALRTLRSLDPAVLVVTLTTLLSTIAASAAGKAMTSAVKKIKTPAESLPTDSASLKYQEPQVTSTCDADFPAASDDQQHPDSMDLDTSDADADVGSTDSTTTSSTISAVKLRTTATSARPPSCLPPPLPPTLDFVGQPPPPPPLPSLLSPERAHGKFVMPLLPPVDFSLPPPPILLPPSRSLFNGPLGSDDDVRHVRQKTPLIGQAPTQPSTSDGFTQKDKVTVADEATVNFFSTLTLQTLYQLPYDVLTGLTDGELDLPLSPFFHDYMHSADPKVLLTASLGRTC